MMSKHIRDRCKTLGINYTDIGIAAGNNPEDVMGIPVLQTDGTVTWCSPKSTHPLVRASQLRRYTMSEQQLVLIEVAVIQHQEKGPSVLLVPPTPLMAAGEEAARYEAIFLAKKEAPDSFDTNRCEVLVRFFD